MEKSETELHNKKEILEKICKDLDPFEPISDESKRILEFFGITEFSDPFNLTKQILLLLEKEFSKKH